jgi:hypothetical protein
VSLFSSQQPTDEPLGIIAPALTHQYSESNLIRSLFISKILQSFELTFASNENSVPTLSLIDFIRIHISTDLAEIVSTAIDTCSSSSSTSSGSSIPFYDPNGPYAPYLSLLFDSGVTPTVIAPTPVTTTTPTPATATVNLSKSLVVKKSSQFSHHLYQINKTNTKNFIIEFLSKSLIRMRPGSGSKIPEFYLETSQGMRGAGAGAGGGGSHDLLLHPTKKTMSLDKRLELIESIVCDAQQMIDTLVMSFQDDENQRMSCSPLSFSHSSFQ